MIIKKYQVDAFTATLFKGNPAAVCLLDEWLTDELLQEIAAEHNLSETAFVVAEEDFYHLRWFTPTMEVPLCGHATLASSFVIKQFIDNTIEEINFKTMSGVLHVHFDGDIINMKFPVDHVRPTEYRPIFMNCFNEKPINVYETDTFYIFEYESAKSIQNLIPEKHIIKTISEKMGIVVTANAIDQEDYTCRLFAPQAGIEEDPATGSIQRFLGTFWGEKLNKSELVCKQLSDRGATLYVSVSDKFVEIGGKAILYCEGNIQLK